MKRLMFSLVVMILISTMVYGATWEPMDSPTTAGLTNVWGTAPDDMFAVGDSGTILHYDGDGDNDGSPDDIWEQMPSPSTAALRGIWGFGPNDVYVTGTECTILHYDGITWEPVPGLPDSEVHYLSGIWGSDSNNIFVAGEGLDNKGHILRWDGSSWSELTIPLPLGTGVLFEVWGRAGDDVYVSGYNGYSSDSTGLIYHYDGNTWELFHPDGKGDHDLPKTRAISGIWGPSDSTELFLAGMTYGGPGDWFGAALRYYGDSWSTEYDPTKWEMEIFQQQTQGLGDVWGSTASNVYMVGRDIIVHYNGSSWSIMDSGKTEWWGEIWGTDTGDVFAVGSNGTILHLSEPEPACWVEQAKVLASDGVNNAGFGISVSVSGDYAIIGAYGDDDNGSSSGSAYIFHFGSISWNEQAKLTASDGAAHDQFGHSVSVSGDYAIIGAVADDDNGGNSGSAYIFKHNGTVWSEQVKLIASDGADGDFFGYSVSICGDYAIVGAPYNDANGSAYVFKKSDIPGDPNWYQQAKLTASDGAAYDLFGISVSVSGDYAVVGAYRDDDNGINSGSAYIFKWDGTSWSEQAKLTASDGAANDQFGYSVSISGDYSIIGAFFDDDNGLNSGSAYIFKRDGTVWSEQVKLIASDGADNDNFGYSVSVSGDYANVGAYFDDGRTGSAYIFKRDGTVWSEQVKLTASDGAANDLFGTSVSISSDYAIVGAYGNDDKGSSSGSAYVFENTCNREPIADAGEEQTVDTGLEGVAQVTLDSSGSYDEDGDELSYCWRWTGGEDCDANGVNPVIELPCGVHTIELIVNDGTEDSDPDYVEITVLDSTPPTIICPPNVTLECPANTSPSATGEATGSDTCGEVTITHSDSSVPGCGNTGVITRTWTATDAAGNNSSCVQVITVQDTTVPVITGVPADETVECDSVPAPANPTAADNCDPDVPVSFSETRTDGDCPSRYTLTRTWTATDDCGKTTTETQVITVIDTTSPTISNLDADYLLAAVGQTVTFSVDVNDNCDNDVDVEWDFGDGTAPSSNPSHVYEQPGIYTVTVTATDDCGNEATDSIIVVVYDPTAGFTTGGGWFMPDSDSFIDDVGVTDTVSKANFGFIVRYKMGADNPDGNLEFQYKAGDIDLKSSDMEWLVVQSATKVRFKGLATINGQGLYTFKVTAEDNGEPGANDWFKIEIWMEPDVDTENSPPTPKHKAQGYLGGGNIQIHQK